VNLMHELKIKRIYEEASGTDGSRVLVDRLWPRGIKKEAAKLTAWWKDISPSNELRKWYGHDHAKFVEFSERYRAELEEYSDKEQLIAEVREILAAGNLTLVFAAKDERENNAVVLAEWLQDKI